MDRREKGIGRILVDCCGERFCLWLSETTVEGGEGGFGWRLNAEKNRDVDERLGVGQGGACTGDGRGSEGFREALARTVSFADECVEPPVEV